MTDPIYQLRLSTAKVISTPTRFVEIFNWQDADDTTEEVSNSYTGENKVKLWEGVLSEANILPWLKQEGDFQRPNRLQSLGALRLLPVIQDSCASETFEPNKHYTISLPPTLYLETIKTLRLSRRQLDTANSIGPFLWSHLYRKPSDSSIDSWKHYFQLIYRNFQRPTSGFCRGWELSLTYDPSSHTTTGFFRGTSDSLVRGTIDVLKTGQQEALNPLLLLRMIFQKEMRLVRYTSLQSSRELLQKIEEAVLDNPQALSLRQLNDAERQLLYVHKKLNGSKLDSYLRVVKNMEKVITEAASLESHLSQDELLVEQMRDQQIILAGSVDFYAMKLEGARAEQTSAISYMDILRVHVQNRLSITLAEMQQERDEKRQAENRRSAYHQEVFAWLGVVFFPATLFAALYSTSFFNFRASGGERIVSPKIWVFFATSLPASFLVVLVLMWSRILPTHPLKSAQPRADDEAE